MTRIPEQSAGTVAQITDSTKMYLATADRHTVDGSGYGTSYYYTFSVFYQALLYRLMTYTAHGLVSGDVGKPLSGADILDDTDDTLYPSHILIESVSANVIRVAPPGVDVVLAVALLDGGNAYDIATSGRYVYWDNSATLYKAAKPADSAANTPEILEIFSVGASTFNARVRSF